MKKLIATIILLPSILFSAYLLACPPKFTAPTLVNPQNPMNYGAACNGSTNDTAAFQSAVNAGDVLVPAGRTCVINGQVNFTTSNRHFECGAGAIIKNTSPNGRMFNVGPGGGRLTGISFVNCYFLGANTVAPSYTTDGGSKQYNIAIWSWDRVDNMLVAGNTFDRWFGQASVETYGGSDGGNGTKIIWNTFKSCGYYGPVFTGSAYGTIANNTITDCAAGVENDNSSQLTGHNLIENNTLVCVHGMGAPDNTDCVMLTGGATGNGADYSTNVVRNNNVSGTADSSGAHPGWGSRIIEGATSWNSIGAKAAKYINNVCGSGCTRNP